ncbi:hypothetical protein E0Y62_11665 [Cytobacillus praedii]|uniref:Uncharacterized protein n=1 Tax=Cytobacillus praedii TaxID=1742358 RepID=A0A4R1B1Y0_9BACI|nr:hypothetical protein E0Y62_11665 [Cytobacillus praedii]
MKEGDADANYAYYALHKLRILPHELMNMSLREKAVIYAMIDYRIEQDRKEEAKARMMSRNKR